MRRESNFSTNYSFEFEDELSEKNGSKLQAIPEEMLHAEGLEGILPDLRHITGPIGVQIRKLLEIHKYCFNKIFDAYFLLLATYCS